MGPEVETRRAPDESDAALINRCIAELAETRGGGDLWLAPRRYLIDTPLVMRTGVRLIGQGMATVLASAPELDGPVITSLEAQALAAADAWFHREGVPVRFAVRDLMIDGSEGRARSGWQAGCGVALYGKGFEITGVQISGMAGHGLVSSGSARGGQEDWRDEPEALFDLRISRCAGDGFLMRGPHDSIIRQAIIAMCRGRGLAVEHTGVQNGACDIEFCHAYGTHKVAIDLATKVKAGFLQGDTGRGAGVRIAGSHMTYVDRIECFKTRADAPEDHALVITAPQTQIGLARVRADWGAGGVRIAAPFCQIGTLDVDGRRNTGGALNGTPNDTTGLTIDSGNVRIGSAMVRNFDAGTGIAIARGRAGVSLAATTMGCATHIAAESLRGCDLRLTMIMAEGETDRAVPGPRDCFDIRRLQEA